MNIVITGFMGTGKSTVGRRVAELLKAPFFDVDDTIKRLPLGDRLELGFEETVRKSQRWGGFGLVAFHADVLIISLQNHLHTTAEFSRHNISEKGRSDEHRRFAVLHPGKKRSQNPRRDSGINRRRVRTASREYFFQFVNPEDAGSQSLGDLTSRPDLVIVSPNAPDAMMKLY